MPSSAPNDYSSMRVSQLAQSEASVFFYKVDENLDE